MDSIDGTIRIKVIIKPEDKEAVRHAGEILFSQLVQSNFESNSGVIILLNNFFASIGVNMIGIRDSITKL